MTTRYVPPQWASEFHGHQCPFMPLGYRMGRMAMEKLGVEREKNHGFFGWAAGMHPLLGLLIAMHSVIARN